MKTLSFGIAVLVGALAARSAEPEASAAYPIGGYWVFARGAAGQWPGTLDAIRQLGGDTLIQFGPRLNPVATPEQATHPVLSACRIDGQPVVEATREALTRLDPPAELARVFVLATPECFGAALLTWPGMDVCIADGNRRFWRLVIPLSGPADPAAVAAPRRYALVVIAGGTHDSLAELLAEAEARRLQVFAGMPIPPPNPQYPWDPWLETLPVTLDVCRRVLADYRDRFGSSPALVGIYQSLETPVAARPLEAVLHAYRAMHPVVRELLPGRRILVSPYWDARITPGRRGTPPDDIRTGIQTIARCEVDIVAPQDSRGTGKVGLFWPHEHDAPVDPRLEPVVGRRSYGEAYCANTRTYYQAAAQGLADLAGAGGPQVELWANLEAFEPGKGVPCGSFTDCQRTTKERLDRAVMFAGPEPVKRISFMWDGLYTATGGLPASLAAEIAADAARPIVVEARAEARAGQPGLVLAGWRLSGGTLELRWTTAKQPQVAELALDTMLGRDAAGAERTTAGWLQSTWLPVQLPAARLELSVRGPGGGCHHPFILDCTPP